MLLGRSFTWPSEASTVKPFPRYFWMVFALAGDSTMTNPFTHFPSVLDFLFPKLARMGRRQQVTGWQQSAVSSQLSAFSSAMPAFFSRPPFRLKAACNLAFPGTPDRVPEAGDTPIRSRNPRQFAGSVQNPHPLVDTFPPRCWHRLK